MGRQRILQSITADIAKLIFILLPQNISTDT